MVSAIDLAKRALIKVLKRLALLYHVVGQATTTPKRPQGPPQWQASFRENCLQDPRAEVPEVETGAESGGSDVGVAQNCLSRGVAQEGGHGPVLKCGCAVRVWCCGVMKNKMHQNYASVL